MGFFKNRKFTGILCAGMLSMGMCFGTMTASAYTADDVAAKARQAGWPENLIQTGYNQWASGQYTQEQLDEAYYSVTDYNDQTEEFIYNSFGMDPAEAKKKTAETTPPETQPETQAENTNAAPAENTDTYISDSEFINMSMEEKQEYVSSLPEEQKSDFINSLSTEARNSIIKQLPTQDKAAIMQKYIDTADTMGMHVTVDNIGEKDISVVVRNEEGVVIDKTGIGVVIDETGISHTKPLVFAGIGILVSIAGFAGLYWYIKRTEEL